MNSGAIRQKFIGLCIFCFFSTQLVYSQGQWNWISGDNTTNKTGTYVTKGPHPNNKPGNRHAAASWTDKSGNLWMFGGYGYGSNGLGQLNDLWKYDISSRQWNWIGGDATTYNPGVYKPGNDPKKNKPGSRSDAVSWTDNAGNLWLFGGLGYARNVSGQLNVGHLNDLWRYDISTDLWNWISGDTTTNNAGLYARNGFDARNKPGGRSDAMSWTDANGNFWLFGGKGYAASNRNEGSLNDLWQFNRARSEWSWIGGDNIINQAGIYKHANDPKQNRPPSRDEASGWVDAKGNLWLFGGDGYAPNAPNGKGQLNDLWKYDTSTRQWSWMSGDSTMDNTGIYIKGPSQKNKPASRNDAVSWKDANGNFWLYGGSNEFAFLNDIWQYNQANNEWSWVSGDSIPNNPGVYFIKEPHPNNKPAGRYGAVNWADASGNMWMFGGYGYILNGEGDFSDLWKFIPCTVPGGTSSTVIVTPGAPYPLSVRSNIGNNYSWSPTDGLDNTKSPTPTVTTNKDVTYLVTMTSGSGCITVDTQKVVVAKPLPGNNKESVVAVPTAFTPNSNNMNDRLKPIPYSIKTLTQFKVFNRWGQLVFETRTLGVGWDGTFKGKPQPTETYTWILECISTSGTTIRRSGKSLLIR